MPAHIGAGDCTITTTQSGNGNYEPAADVTQTFKIGKAAQTISFTTPPAQVYAPGKTVALAATASSGLPVSFASTAAGVCTVAAATVTVVSAGTCTLTASQVGNGNYERAADVTQSFNIGKAAQTISFSAPPAQVYVPGGTVALTASASSGLPVSFASQTVGVCTVAGAIVTMDSAGTCTITASQAGNGNYTAAADVTQSFRIGKAAQTISFTAPSAQIFAPGRTVALTASASSGLPVAFASRTTSVCTVAGATATVVSAGTCTITASQGGSANFDPAPDVTQSFAIGKSPQVIAFTQPADQAYASGLTVPLTATGGASGNPVTFTSTPTGVCRITGAAVTIFGKGACSITAAQAGNPNYLAAVDVTRSFAINSASVTLTLSAAGGSFMLGEPVMLTATASTASAGTPSGVVTFSAGAASLCSGVPLAAGVATCSAKFATSGPRDVVASFAGGGVFATASSKPITIVATDQTARTAKVIGSFVASRTDQILSNEPDTGRQSTKPACAERDTRQPTMRRANVSMTKAT